MKLIVGITGQDVGMKRGIKPSDNTISERLDFGNPSLEDIKVTKKKSKRQGVKTVERTLLISSGQPDKLSQSQKSDDQKPVSLGANVQGSTQQANEQKLAVYNTKANSDSLVWSQNQQKILEWTLTQYPKGTPERWDKIAEHIPGKTKVAVSFHSLLFA